MSFDELKQMNGLTDFVLYLGQALKIKDEDTVDVSTDSESDAQETDTEEASGEEETEDF